MQKKSKGGRPAKVEIPLLSQRQVIAKMLHKKGYNQVQIAYILSIHRSRVNRMLRVRG